MFLLEICTRPGKSPVFSIRQIVILLSPVVLITLPVRHISRSMGYLFVAVSSNLFLDYLYRNSLESMELVSMDGFLKKINKNHNYLKER